MQITYQLAQKLIISATCKRKKISLIARVLVTNHDSLQKKVKNLKNQQSKNNTYCYSLGDMLSLIYLAQESVGLGLFGT